MSTTSSGHLMRCSRASTRLRRIAVGRFGGGHTIHSLMPPGPDAGRRGNEGPAGAGDSLVHVRAPLHRWCSCAPRTAVTDRCHTGQSLRPPSPSKEPNQEPEEHAPDLRELSREPKHFFERRITRCRDPEIVLVSESRRRHPLESLFGGCLEERLVGAETREKLC